MSVIKLSRSLEYYAVIGPHNPLHYLVVGYVVDEVPRVMLDYLYGALDQAIGKVDNSDTDPAAGSAQEEGNARVGFSEYFNHRGHDDDGDNTDDYVDSYYDSEERQERMKNKKNSKKRKKGISKKNKNRTSAYRRKHRHAFSFPAKSSDNTPGDSGESIQVRNVAGGGGQGGGNIGNGGDLGNSDGLDGGGDTFSDGNVNNQNAEAGGSSFNDGNENNGPGVYTDANVNDYNPNSGNSVYSDGNLNYEANGVSVFQEENLNNGNSNRRDGRYTGVNDKNGTGDNDGINNKTNENYTMQKKNTTKSNILPTEVIKSQNDTQRNTNI